MNNKDSILEISVASFENGVTGNKSLKSRKTNSPWHTLFLDIENKVLLFVKNISKDPLTFQSFTGIPSPKGSNETERATSLYLDFGTLLSRNELENIMVNSEEKWNFKVFERTGKNDQTGKNFFYLALSPEKDQTLLPGEVIRFMLTISPKGNASRSYLSVHIENLKTIPQQHAPSLDQTEFLLPVRIEYFNNELKLEYGIINDEIFYISDKQEIENKLNFFIMNVGEDIEFGKDNKAKLTISLDKIGMTKNSKSLAVKGTRKIPDTHGDFWELALPIQINSKRRNNTRKWKTGESYIFTLSGNSTRNSKEGVGALRVAYQNIPGYRDGYMMISINKAQKRNFDGDTVFNEKTSFTGPTFGAVPPGTVLPFYSYELTSHFEKNGLGKMNTIYEGWALCNGSNGTPDLRGRFVVGWETRNSSIEHTDASYRMGEKGGEKYHQLTVNEMPKHNHGRDNEDDLTQNIGEHDHTFNFYNGWAEAGGKYWKGIVTKDDNNIGTKRTYGAGAHEHKIYPRGDDEPHENRPPFYVLAYLMKLEKRFIAFIKTQAMQSSNCSVYFPHPFSDEKSFNLTPSGHKDFSKIKAIKKIIINAGNVVDSVKITWIDVQGRLVECQDQAGNNSGSPNEINFSKDEYVTEISGALRKLWGKQYLAKLTIKTNHTVYGPYGLDGKTPFTQTFDKDEQQLISFAGSHSTYVSRLGFVTRKMK